jgi:hypothetical protein
MVRKYHELSNKPLKLRAHPEDKVITAIAVEDGLKCSGDRDPALFLCYKMIIIN